MQITGSEINTLNENLEPVETQNNAVDPFNEITIASVCSEVYRTKFLEETWKVKLWHNDQLSEWMPAKKLNNELFIQRITKNGYTRTSSPISIYV